MMTKICGGPSTREKIINATLSIISIEGFQKLTIRKIAAIAGVNIAAVNYHFGSKDLLVNEALKSVTYQMKESFKLLQDNRQPEEKLRSFMRAYSDAAQRYPAVLQNFISSSMHNHQVRDDYEEYLKNEGFTLIRRNLEELGAMESESILQIVVVQILSCLSYPVLLGDRLQPTMGLDYNDTQERYEYVELLLDSVLGQMGI